MGRYDIGVTQSTRITELWQIKSIVIVFVLFGVEDGLLCELIELNVLSKFIFALSVLLITGCATAPPIQQQWTLAGGSKADAIVELGYEVTLKENQRVIASDDQALKEATEACKRWGYATATPASAPTLPGVILDGSSTCLRYQQSLWSLSGHYCSLIKAGKRFQCS